MFQARVIDAVAGDLRRTAAELRAGAASARGVALAEGLVTRGDSPLHGREPEPLREELRRIRYLLSDVSTSASAMSNR
jgi:hypothetical protein